MNPALDALLKSHQELRKAVPKLRKTARETDGDLHALGRETFRIWDRMRDNGESFNQRCAYLVGILKQILRHGREWKYLCERCDDYGLELHECSGDATCGRHRVHLPHSYGKPCVCSKGRAFEKPAKDVYPEDFTQAGRTAKPKPRGFQRMGS